MLDLKELRIIYVEDEMVDQFIFRNAFEKAGLGQQIDIANDGDHGLEIIRKYQSENPKKPIILFIDIHLPKMDGIEFLKKLDDLKFSTRPLIYFLTTSFRPSEVEQAYQLGVAGYILKDDAGDRYCKLPNFVKQLSEIITLPS